MKTATHKETQTLLGNRLLKVLLVDDEATDRIPVERILRTCSSPVEFVVESVVNLSEAIRSLAEKKYDAILLDLELPDSSGIEILQQVIKVAPDIPVVVLTELDDEQTGFSALEDGATDYLVKDLPLDVVLVRTIVYALQRKKIQMQSLKLAHDNNERMKELNCLYGISKLVETPGISLEEMLEKTVCLIPAGWQYPDIACARIVFEGKEYKTDNFKPSKWTQSADITLQGQKVGTVEVCYEQERPELDEGPFLGEKRDLIDAIGERLGHITERKRAEEALLLKENIIKCSSSAIATCDPEGNMTYGNPSFLKTWGFDDPDEFLGRSFWEIWLIKDRLNEIMQVLRSEGAWFGETKAIRKDGAIFDVQVSAAMVFDGRGNPVALTSTSMDITERKNKEKLILDANRRLEKVSEELSTAKRGHRAKK
jgi:PAS domain S-box-containing protein